MTGENASNKWNPRIDASARTLEGIGARTYYLLLEWGAWAGGGLLIALLGGMVFLDTGWVGHPVLALIMVLLAVDAFVYVPAVIVGMIVRRRREVSAGYTTLVGEFPNVDLVDPKTERVIRIAGEKRLPHHQYVERLKLVNEDFERHSGAD